MKQRENGGIMFLVVIILVIDFLLLASHLIMGHTLLEFSTYGDSSEFLGLANNMNFITPHFPGYGWLLFLVNIITFRFFEPAYLAIGINIVFQIMGGILAFRLAKLYLSDINDRKALFMAVLIVIFPFQNLFLTLLPLSDSFKLFISLAIFYCYKTRKQVLVIILTTILVSTRNAFVLSAFGLSLFFLYQRRYRLFCLSLMAYMPPIAFVLYRCAQVGDLFYYLNVDRYYMTVDGGPANIVRFPFYFIIQLLQQSPVGLLPLLYQLPYLFLIIIYGYRLLRNKDYFPMFFSGLLIIFLISADARFAYATISRYLAFCVPFIFPIYLDIFQKNFIFKNKYFRILFGVYVLSLSFATLVYSFVSFPESNLSDFIRNIKPKFFSL